ncbi:MAG: 2TM domain-containing protein [Pseudomonadota bacterium]
MDQPSPDPPTGQDEESPAGRYGQLAVRTFKPHARLFWAVNAALTLINIATGAPWWALWPLVAWGLPFSVHFFIYKSLTVDESWTDDRIEELRWKSYDLGHVEDLEDRIRGDDYSTRPVHRRDPDWWRRSASGELIEPEDTPADESTTEEREPDVKSKD